MNKYRYPRLSDQNIADDILRSFLYRDLKAIAQDLSRPDDITIYEVKPDEEYRPDLISFRVYGTDSLRWLVSLVVESYDETQPIESGVDIRLPNKDIVRERIRHYMENGSVENAASLIESTGT